MDNKALYIRNICKQREYLQLVDKLVSLFLTALDIEGKYRCTAVREVLLIKCVVGMVGQRGVVYLFNLGMI